MNFDSESTWFAQCLQWSQAAVHCWFRVEAKPLVQTRWPLSKTPPQGEASTHPPTAWWEARWRHPDEPWNWCSQQHFVCFCRHNNNASQINFSIWTWFHQSQKCEIIISVLLNRKRNCSPDHCGKQLRSVEEDCGEGSFRKTFSQHCYNGAKHPKT